MDGTTLIGVVTRRDLLDDVVPGDRTMRELVRRAPASVSDGSFLREAADQLVRAGVGRLPVVSEEDPARVVGILTRSDLLGAHRARLDAAIPQVARHPLVSFGSGASSARRNRGDRRSTSDRPRLLVAECPPDSVR